MSRMLAALLTLISCSAMVIPKLAREISRYRLGKAALRKCRAEDVPATLQALGFDHDSLTSKITVP